MCSMFSSCDITGTLGSINLGGATVLGTFSDGYVIDTLGGATAGTYLRTTFVFFLACCGCMFLNNFANLSMTCNCLSLILKVVLGPVFFVIYNNYLAALVDCSVVKDPGIIRCCGKNSTTYACIYLLVLGTK